MGYGGVISKIVDPFGIGNPDAVDPANPGKVGQDYMALLNNFAQGLGTQAAADAKWSPMFTGLGLQGGNQALKGTEAQTVDGTYVPGQKGIFSLFGQSMDVVQGQNPPMAGLNRMAADQLNLGSQVDPTTLAQMMRSVKGAQGAGGWGYDPVSLAEQAMSTGALGEQMRASRMGQAANVARLNQQDQQTALNLEGSGFNMAKGAGPQMISAPASYDTFNTAYNARSAANIATGNNEAAANSY